MAVTELCQLLLTVIGLHEYRPKEAEFPPRCAQTQGARADQNSAKELTSSRDEAVEERDRCLSFAMMGRPFTI